MASDPLEDNGLLTLVMRGPWPIERYARVAVSVADWALSDEEFIRRILVPAYLAAKGRTDG